MKKALIVLSLGLAVLLGPALPAAAQSTGLPVPRYVSLRADEVNMRAGPGYDYPIEWVYHRRWLPVEVVAEFKHWRKVRDWQGTEGWVHQSLLSGRRTGLVMLRRRVLRDDPAPEARPLAILEPGVIVHLLACPAGRGYCRVRVANIAGWLDRRDVWGVALDEVID